MEDVRFSRSSALSDSQNPGPKADRKVGWKDLREWIDQIEKDGPLKRISAPVDPDEELSAITFMTTRSETAPALLFENLEGGTPGMSVLSNMLGASAARYAHAVGLDGNLSL